MRVRLFEDFTDCHGPGGGNFSVPIPSEIVWKLGWKKGDTIILDINVNDPHSLVLTKKEAKHDG